MTDEKNTIEGQADSSYRENATETKTGWPAGIPYIVGNEAAERFSFYGMKAILWIYSSMLLVGFRELAANNPERLHAEQHATEIGHLFNAGVYAFPVIGAVMAERLFGKYKVIMWLSVIYCLGHAVLSVAGETLNGLYLGLALIAVGSGGIKPNVSANVGDQFGKHNSHLIEKIYQIFYFSINFGSFFSTLLIPKLYTKYGPDVAFGIPGVLMAIATFVFWLGRNKFVKVPPNPGGKLGALDTVASISLFIPVLMFLFGDELGLALRVGISIAGIVLWYVLFQWRQSIHEDTGFFGILIYSFKNSKVGKGFFDPARKKYGEEVGEGPLAVMRIGLVFSMVSIFWALFDQHATSWVNQANRMYLPRLPDSIPLLGGQIEASQISALNPVMVMIIIPIMNLAVYPLIRKMGFEPTPLRRMTVGMFLGAVGFATVALIQVRVDAAPGQVNVFWQMIPYWVMTTAEVLVSITGLEFAYTQAPRSMKSIVMSFWLLTVSFGNKLAAVLAGMEGLSLVNFFWLFAALMAGAALIFAILAYTYKGKTYLQTN